MRKKPTMLKQAKETQVNYDCKVCEKCGKAMKAEEYWSHPCNLPPHEHSLLLCLNCQDIFTQGSAVVKPHEHNHLACGYCAEEYNKGFHMWDGHICSKSPVEIKWQDREVIVYKPMPTWHIHMTWLILCIVSGALGFYFGYPNWK